MKKILAPIALTLLLPLSNAQADIASDLTAGIITSQQAIEALNAPLAADENAEAIVAALIAAGVSPSDAVSAVIAAAPAQAAAIVTAAITAAPKSAAAITAAATNAAPEQSAAIAKASVSAIAKSGTTQQPSLPAAPTAPTSPDYNENASPS